MEEVIYQIKVHLKGVSPQVIRRVQLSSQTNLGQLHGILQIMMSWGDHHLHVFHMKGKDYGLRYPGTNGYSDNPRNISLSYFQFRIGDKFTYEYNFHEGCVHILRIEKILPCQKKKYPICIESKRLPESIECRESSIFNKILERAEKMGDIKKDAEILEQSGWEMLLRHQIDQLIISKKSINSRLLNMDHPELENSHQDTPAVRWTAE